MGKGDDKTVITPPRLFARENSPYDGESSAGSSDFYETAKRLRDEASSLKKHIASEDSDSADTTADLSTLLGERERRPTKASRKKPLYGTRVAVTQGVPCFFLTLNDLK